MAVDVQLPSGVYTLTDEGWSGPKADVVALLNDDCPPERPWIEGAVGRAARKAAQLYGGSVVAERELTDAA